MSYHSFFVGNSVTHALGMTQILVNPGALLGWMSMDIILEKWGFGVTVPVLALLNRVRIKRKFEAS